MFTDYRSKLVAAGYHLLASIVVVAAVSTLVMLVWYPDPLWRTSGGLSLLGLLAACDLVLGPLLTFIVFSLKKSRKELSFDLVIVIAIQITALTYGVWTVWQARPLYIVLERDLFRVIRLTDLPEPLMTDIPAQFRSISLGSPATISLRKFSGLGEQLEAAATEILGLPLSAQPKFWIPYNEGPDALRKAGKSLTEFKEKFPTEWVQTEAILSRHHITADEVVYFPFVDRQVYWTVFVRVLDGTHIGYLAVDPYS